MVIFEKKKKKVFLKLKIIVNISKSNYITLKPFISLWEEPAISLVYFGNCSML